MELSGSNHAETLFSFTFWVPLCFQPLKHYLVIKFSLNGRLAWHNSALSMFSIISLFYIAFFLKSGGNLGFIFNQRKIGIPEILIYYYFHTLFDLIFFNSQ